MRSEPGQRRSRAARRTIRLLLLALALAIGTCILADLWVRRAARDLICHHVSRVPHCTTAIVLGTKCLPHGKLSPRLATRCDKAIELYNAGKVDKLLMSGDNRDLSNNEPDSMRRYAIRHGVPECDVIVDPAGLRTYDSMYRAKHVYGNSRLIVVTQEFHLARSIFFCQSQGIKAYGVSADLPGTFRDTLREPMARVLALIDVYVRRSRPEVGGPDSENAGTPGRLPMFSMQEILANQQRRSAMDYWVDLSPSSSPLEEEPI